MQNLTKDLVYTNHYSPKYALIMNKKFANPKQRHSKHSSIPCDECKYIIF